jgi:ABC-type glycerol-3-phosphate transport system permease component
MAAAGSGGRTARAVTQVAAGPAGRALSRRPAQVLGRVVAIAVILLWSLFPIYWALNTSLSTLSGADSAPAHYFPSPLVGTSYRAVSGIGGAGSGISGQLGR